MKISTIYNAKICWIDLDNRKDDKQRFHRCLITEPECFRIREYFQSVQAQARLEISVLRTMAKAVVNTYILPFDIPL